MSKHTGLLAIFDRYLAVTLKDGTRKRSMKRWLLLVICPCAVSVALAYKLGHPQGDHLALIVAVYSVLAAVLVGLIPLIHSIIGQTDPDRCYDVGERPLFLQEMHRIRALQDLHAAIAAATIMLVGALLVSILMVFALPSQQEADSIGIVRKSVLTVVATVIYAAGLSTALAFFDVASGVYEAMENHTECLKRRLADNVADDVSGEENREK